MFGFGKSARKTPTGEEASDDLLAEQEAAEFEASVRAARERARSATAKTEALTSAPEPEEPEIEWAEQDDVYRPTPLSLTEVISSLGIEMPANLEKQSPLLAMRTDALNKLSDHVRTDTRIELGGLLVGRAFHDAVRRTFVILVEAALPALQGDGTATSFTYTSESWRAILPEFNKMAEEWTIVGSYHSHPGLGVFLSSTDLETQQDVFPHEWQAAVVIDPISGDIGYFAGIEGKPCRVVMVPRI